MHGIAGELNFICLRFFLIANSLAFTSKREQPSQGEGTGRGQKHLKSCSRSCRMTPIPTWTVTRTYIKRIVVGT